MQELQVSCPECDAPDAVELQALSDDAWMNYFRCPRCGCVWVVDRDGFVPPHRVSMRRAGVSADVDDS